MSDQLRVVGVNFDHMHMESLLAQVAADPDCDLIGLSDPDPSRMVDAASRHQLGPDRLFTDEVACMESLQPDMVVLCAGTASHGEWVERLAPFGVHVLVEKPFAASLEEADRMLDAMRSGGGELVVNWPLAWQRCHVTAKRLIDEGAIGTVTEIHYYDGNRGPLADRTGTMSDEEVETRKRGAWWYRKDRGGGSLLDYLGYGVTLGTWFHGGAKPSEVTSMVAGASDLEVDEQSVTIARYPTGLSTFQTRWGTFTDPWVDQPQPKCGFVIVGTDGTISSYDNELSVRVQTRDRPAGFDVAADELRPPFENPIQNFVHSLRTGAPIHEPLSPRIGRIGQQIVDSAMLSAERGEAVPLVGEA